MRPPFPVTLADPLGERVKRLSEGVCPYAEHAHSLVTDHRGRPGRCHLTDSYFREVRGLLFVVTAEHVMYAGWPSGMPEWDVR